MNNTMNIKTKNIPYSASQYAIRFIAQPSKMYCVLWGRNRNLSKNKMYVEFLRENIEKSYLHWGV